MKHIIWSVDAFQPKNRAQDNCVKVLDVLENKTGADVEPVYVLSDGMLGLSIPEASLVRNFKTSAQKSMKTQLAKYGVKNMKDSAVLVRAMSSTTDAVKTLDQYARKQSADLIVIGSHGRKGLSRMLLGSFAETLVQNAKTPVLVVGPKVSSSVNLNNIFFATDFSKESEKVFAQVLKLASDLKARITIFHAISYPGDPVLQSGTYLLGGGFGSLNKHFEELADTRKEQAKKWVTLAKNKGVHARFEIETWSTSPAEAILASAKRNKSGMIAMAAQSGKVATALLGSVARQVVRHAETPVWVIRR